MSGVGSIWEVSVPSVQCCSEHNTALEKYSLFKIHTYFGGRYDRMCCGTRHGNEREKESTVNSRL